MPCSTTDIWPIVTDHYIRFISPSHRIHRKFGHLVAIKEFVIHVGVHGVLSIEQQQKSIQHLSDNICEIGDGIASDIHDTQDLIQEVMTALKGRQEKQ